MGSTTIVGGGEQMSSGGSETTVPVIWINDRGPYPLRPDSHTAVSSDQTVTGLFASDQHELLASISEVTNDDGMPGTDGFVAPVDISRSKPVIGAAIPLPLPYGATSSYASAVGGVPGGKPDSYTIAGSVSDWVGGTAGALWAATTASGATHVQQPVPVVQPGVSQASQCPVHQILSMNAFGDGAGFAFCNGQAMPIAVYPAALASLFHVTRKLITKLHPTDY
jgi:hypothetical protein